MALDPQPNPAAPGTQPPLPGTSPEAATNGDGNRAAAGWTEAEVQRIADRAAVAARKETVAEYKQKLADAQKVKDRLARLVGDDADDDAIEALAQRLEADRAKAQAAGAHVDPQAERRQKALEKQLADLQAKAEDSERKRIVAEERRLEADISRVILGATDGVALRPAQVHDMIRPYCSCDAETGEIGVVDHDGTEDPPWLEDDKGVAYTGADGIACYVRAFLARDDNANLRRPVNQGGAGSAAPGGASSPTAAAITELKAREELVEDLRKKQEQSSRWGPKWLAEKRKLKAMREAAQVR